MPSISAATSQNITIPAGQVLHFDPAGAGTAVISSGQEAGTSYNIGTSAVAIGPFSSDRVVSASASSAISYYIGAAQIDIVATRTAPDNTPTITGDGAAAVNALSTLISVTNDGDSFTARTHQAHIPSATAVSNGVATITDNSHGLASGTLINVTGAASEAVNVVRTAITRLSANQYSFPCPGAPDGAIATGVAQFQIMAWPQQTLEGIFPYLQRLSGKAFSLLQNGGMSGYRSADYLARYDVALKPYVSDVHIHWGYFNDLQFGVTVAASCANVQTLMLKRRAQGVKRGFVVSALPIPSGVYTWPTLSAPLVTLTDATAAAWIANWNRTMRDWCVVNNCEFIDVFAPSVDVTTGYALAGTCKASDIHPSQKSNYLAAKLILARIASTSYRPTRLAADALDNVGADASNRNLCRAAPVAQGAGGTPGAGETTAYTAWATGSIPASRWRTNAGNLYYTANGGTAANAPTHTSGSQTGADGITWVYAGTAVGTAGVPANWRVISGSTCPTFVALVDKTRADGTAYKALRCTAIPTINNDQLSITYVATDIVAGDVLNFSLLASVNSKLAATNATLSGQALKSLTAQHDYIIDGVSYLLTEATGGVGAANEMQIDDYTDAVFGVEPIAVPPGSSITQARYTLTALWSGAGIVQFDVALTTLTH